MSTTHTDQLRPDAVLSARMSAAYKDGRDTARARQRRTLRPWSPQSGDPVTRVLAAMWSRGYTAGNPVRE